MKEVINVPEGVNISVKDYVIEVEGPKGKTSMKLKNRLARVSVEEGKVVIVSDSKTKRGKSVVNTFKAHINNLIRGVQEGFTAKLRICYAHFPMTVKVENNKLIIENFGGEKVPRKTKIMPGCEVKIQGSEVTVTGVNKEMVGQTAANMEITTRIKKRDRRLFQDGIWIIKKPGKEGL